jgi:hypothetical protein
MARKSIEQVVRRFVKLRHQSTETDRELKELRPIVEERLKKQPDMKEEIAGHMLMLVPKTKPTLDLKGAVAKFGEQLERMLAQFRGETHFNEIRID